MDTISINAPDGPIDAPCSVPDGKGPWPGVVIVHDAIGYWPDNERISRKVAVSAVRSTTSWPPEITCSPAAGHRRRHCGLLHGRPIRTRYVPQGLRRLGAVLRHATATKPAQDARRGLPNCRQLRPSRPRRYRCGRQTAEGRHRDGHPGRHQGLSGRRPQLPQPAARPPLVRIAGFGYNAAAEEDAWSRVFASFGEHLHETAS